jgi:hypothetical protein
MHIKKSQIELQVLEIRFKKLHKNYIWTHKYHNNPNIINRWTIQLFAMYN